MHRVLTVGTSAALLVGAAACADVTGVNRNPNSPEDVPATTLFTNATREAVDSWLGAGYDLRGTEFVVQHQAEVYYPDEDSYRRLTGASTDGWFNSPYSLELEDFQKVVAKGEEATDAGIYGPGLVMRTWTFGYLTDTWGDIPYSEALQGDQPEASNTPAYDPQQAIYDDFFTTLTRASTDLASATASLGAADPIYGGEPASWQKFANSLHARFALRVVNVDQAKADAELRAAFGAPGGLITTNADNAVLPWPGDGVYNNPWSSNFETRDDNRMSRTLITAMTGMSDPRVAVYAQPTQDAPGTYAGQPNGLKAADAAAYATTTSRPGLTFFPARTTYGSFPGGTGPDQPSYLMTAAEVLFIQAEAAERGLGGLGAGQAAGFYEAAIRASMEQWGVAPAAVETYLTNAAVAYKGGTEGLKQIAVQKWIALFTDGGQAWAEWRRTCQPTTIRPGPDAIVAEVPRRFQYSPSEYIANGEQVNAAVDRMGGDEFSTRMWWDSNPTAAPTYEAGCGVR